MRKTLEPGERAEEPEFDARKVLDVLRVFRTVKGKVWVGGGWGVDALVGEQTREHADLDVSFDDQHEGELIEVFAEQGYRISLDDRPTRFVLTDPEGRQIDMHPVRFDGDGVGTQLVLNGEPFLIQRMPSQKASSMVERCLACLSPNKSVSTRGIRRWRRTDGICLLFRSVSALSCPRPMSDPERGPD